MDIRIRATEGDEQQPYLLWDTDFDNSQDPARLGNAFHGDWKLAQPTDQLNKGGLKANAALHTAIGLALWTWKRAEPYEMPPDTNNPMGWWGDKIDLDTDNGEAELGSKLWLLQRSTLSDATARKAEAYCYEALQPIVNQGAVAQLIVTASYDTVRGFMFIDVQAFSEAGDRVYDQKFSLLWSQIFAGRRA